MIAQTFVPTAELIIPTETQTYEAKPKIEKHLVAIETKMSKSSI